MTIADWEDDALLLLRELRKGGYEMSHERVDTPEALAFAYRRQIRGPGSAIATRILLRLSSEKALNICADRE